MTVETEDFDRGAFSSRGSLHIRTEKSTVQSHTAITELCRSVERADAAPAEALISDCSPSVRTMPVSILNRLGHL